MGLLARLLGREKKSSITTSRELAEYLQTGGMSEAGTRVTWQTALDVSTVLACCRVIANGVSQVPFRLYQEANESRKPATGHKLYGTLYRRPNPWQTSFEFRETLMFHVLLTGNAFVFVNRIGSAREVRELIPIEPGRVTVEQATDYTLTYKVTGLDGQQMTFPADAIWHLRGPSWNSWQGLESVKMARDAIGLTMALEKSQSKFQKNGAKTTGLYTVQEKLSPEKYTLLREWFEKEVAQTSEYRPLILDQGADYKPFNMTGVDQQLIETRKHQIEEICREFGVMPIMVGHADKTATYASAEQMFLAHVVYTLSPWYQRIEQSADVNLLSPADIEAGYYTKFTPNALMRGAAKDRGEFYAKALGSGGSPAWMTPNEVRALEEMDAIEGGDELAKPTNAAMPAPADEPADEEEAAAA